MEKKPYKGPERRRYVRVKAKVSIRYTFDGEEPETYPEQGEAATRNIGEGGVLIEADKVFPEAALLNLEITLSNRDSPIRALARVIWAKETDEKGYHSIGLSFIKMDEKDKEAIIKFIEERL